MERKLFVMMPFAPYDVEIKRLKVEPRGVTPEYFTQSVSLHIVTTVER